MAVTNRHAPASTNNTAATTFRITRRAYPQPASLDDSKRLRGPGESCGDHLCLAGRRRIVRVPLRRRRGRGGPSTPATSASARRPPPSACRTCGAGRGRRCDSSSCAASSAFRIPPQDPGLVQRLAGRRVGEHEVVVGLPARLLEQPLELAADLVGHRDATRRPLRLRGAELAEHPVLPHADARARSSRRRATGARAARPAAARSSRRCGTSPGRSPGTGPGGRAPTSASTSSSVRNRISTDSGTAGSSTPSHGFVVAHLRCGAFAKVNSAERVQNTFWIDFGDRPLPSSVPTKSSTSSDVIDAIDFDPKNGARCTRTSLSRFFNVDRFRPRRSACAQVARADLLRPSAARRPRA